MSKFKHSIICFSGGRTSGYMLRRLLDKHKGKLPDNWIVLFANTGRERNETLDFVNDVSVKLGVDVKWLEYCRVPASSIDLSVFPTKQRASYVAKQAASGGSSHWFKEVDYKSASRQSDPRPFNELLEWMSVLPNVTSRACTAEMKIRTMMRFLWSSGVTQWVDHIGIRSDEVDRAFDLIQSAPSFVKLKFPLATDGVREEEVLNFWKHNDFDLNLESYEGNCDLCFLKSKAKKIRLITENPGMADWWSSWEQKKSGVGNGGQFRRDYTYAKLLEMAIAEDVDADDSDEACSCTSGAYTWSEDESNG